MSIKYRIPIRLNGWVEFEDGAARGTIDTGDMEYSPLPYVSEWGTDSYVVEVVLGDEREVESDIHIVMGIRDAVPAEIEWSVI